MQSSTDVVIRSCHEYAMQAECMRVHVQVTCVAVLEIMHLPGPALCSAVTFRLPSMVHTVKAVDVVPTVGCNDLITATTKFDAGHKRHPTPSTTWSGGHAGLSCCWQQSCQMS